MYLADVRSGLCQLIVLSRAARRGMWKDGLVGETPSEYKRRNAGAGDVAPAPRRITSKATGWWGALRQRFLRW